MKILFILTYYYPHWTGLTKYAQRLAEGLASQGDRVSVLATKHDDSLKDREIIKKVEVIRKPILFRLSRTLISIKFILSFWKLIKENDSIIVYLPFAEVLFVSAIAKLWGKKLILVHNGDLVLPGGIFNRVLEAIYYWSTKLSLSLCSNVVVYTSDYANHSQLLSQFRNKWVEIWPLFVIPKPREEEIRQMMEKYNLQGKKIIGFSGRFVEEKGVDILLKAIPLVKAKIKKVHFVFVGEYKMAYENFYQKCIELIKQNEENITFLGLIKNENILASFYAMCDCLVLPSRTECLGSVQVEAMLCGSPVVASNIPGARMIVGKTGMGVVVEKENPQSLARGIIEVLNNRPKYMRNEANVKKIYDYEKTLREYKKVIG